MQVLDNGDIALCASSRPPPAAPNVPANPDAIDANAEGTGTNVFVLFDTSNYMYRGFVYASDSIADFIRGLDRSDSIAVYTYSRNLNRAVPLNRDRGKAISGLSQGCGRRRFRALQLSAAHSARRR